MIYVRGDTHGDFTHYMHQIQSRNTTTEDVCIILGDAGLNFYGHKKDAARKKIVNDFPITTFCIHGNHEIRPQTISTYAEKMFYGGRVLYEPEFPNLLFAIDGEVYDFDGLKTIVIGGAYSVDKSARISCGLGWWADEQPSADVKKYVESQLKEMGNSVDVVLSHTCPTKYIPREMFLSFVDQRTVDRSTEDWLDNVEDVTDYKKWYCGHWHTNKNVEKMVFLYDKMVPLTVNGGEIS